MKKYLLTLALTCLLLGAVLNHSAEAQSTPVVAPPSAPLPPGEPLPLAPPVVVPGPVIPEACPDGVKTRKICVSEEKPKTKIVYGARYKDYCIRGCDMRLLAFLRGDNKTATECATCSGGICSKPCHRHVLVKYVVDDCPVKTCVVKEVIDERAPKGKKVKDTSCPTGECAGGVAAAAPAVVAAPPAMLPAPQFPPPAVLLPAANPQSLVPPYSLPEVVAVPPVEKK